MLKKQKLLYSKAKATSYLVFTFTVVVEIILKCTTIKTSSELDFIRKIL